MFSWPVVPLCDRQLRDINPSDIQCNGVYRTCSTYHAGGGYDKFPKVFCEFYPEYRTTEVGKQFVVQLQGCPLKCPYCYVTDDGILSVSLQIPTNVLVDNFYEVFAKTSAAVFHLMGGAPALYIEHWPELLEALKGMPFHSDLLLCEKPYSEDLLKDLSTFHHTLYAVSIKKPSFSELQTIARSPLSREVFEDNIKKLISSKLPFYITFTGMNNLEISAFYTAYPQLKPYRAMAFPIIPYKALDP